MVLDIRRMPTLNEKLDPILIRFRAALDKTYGTRIERVVLFGSHARGEAGPDSDYDIAVFLRDLDSFGAEAGRIATIGTEFSTIPALSSTQFPSRRGLTKSAPA